MSIYFTWFTFSELGKPKLYQNMWCFTRKWGFYLVGCLTVKNYWGLLTGDDGVGLLSYTRWIEFD